MRVGQFYFLAGELVRLEHLAPSLNEIVITNFDKGKKQIIDYSSANSTLHPAYRIGEVGILLGRKPDTIRSWEDKGIVPKQRQWQIGEKKFLRFYTSEDVVSMRDVVSSIHRGRPRKDKRTTSDIPPASEVKKYVRERIKNI